MIGIASMILSFPILGISLWLAFEYSTWWLLLLILSLAMFLSPVVFAEREHDRILASKASEAMAKFGTTNPDDDAVCSVCRQPYGAHYFPYECPNNAFYNYQLKQYETK